MIRQNEFVEFMLEQLTPIGGVRARAMFGGYGIYQGDIMFAIIVDDRLYFKTDGVTRHEFLARGLNPSTYAARGKTVSLQYYEAPPEVFEEHEAMRSWAQQAIDVALASKTNKDSPARLSRQRR